MKAPNTMRAAEMPVMVMNESMEPVTTGTTYRKEKHTCTESN